MNKNLNKSVFHSAVVLFENSEIHLQWIWFAPLDDVCVCVCVCVRACERETAEIS